MNKVTRYSDKEILKAIRSNSETGQDLLCSQFGPLIRAVTKWHKWNFTEDEQQDVQQEIYIQLQKALPTFKQQGSLTGFVKTVAVRQCINEVRRQVRWRTFMIPSIQKEPDGDWSEMEFEHPDAPNPYHEIIQKERWQSLHAALQELSETCKTAILLFYVQDLSYQEISGRLGIAPTTVGSRLAKCLNKLHVELRQHPAFKRSYS